MVMASSALREDYWDSLEIDDQDIEALYNHLLEIETPQTPDELLQVLVQERIRREIANIEKQRSSGGEIYTPKQSYTVGQNLVFSALNWRKAQVTAVRPGQNPDLGVFGVASVKFENGEEKEFAMGFPEHPLNNPQDLAAGNVDLDITQVLRDFGDTLQEILEEGLEMSGDFVRIAGRWFPQALLVVRVGAQARGGQRVGQCSLGRQPEADETLHGHRQAALVEDADVIQQAVAHLAAKPGTGGNAGEKRDQGGFEGIRQGDG